VGGQKFVGCEPDRSAHEELFRVFWKKFFAVFFKGVAATALHLLEQSLHELELLHLELQFRNLAALKVHASALADASRSEIRKTARVFR
jgi:hypothetical protein